jgi:Flp pilus assembly pilin Flp
VAIGMIVLLATFRKDISDALNAIGDALKGAK